MSLTNDFFIEEEIDGCFLRLLDEQVNYFLREMELPVPLIDISSIAHNRQYVYPEIYITECERTEKERIICIDAYSVVIVFPVPEHENADLHCYAYAAAFDKALDLNPTLGDIASRAVLTGKKYIHPKKPHCGEDWQLVLSVRVLVERKPYAG